MISAGNLVLTKENVKLRPALTEKMVLLRMNRDFMKYMRIKHTSPKFNNDTLRSGSANEDTDDIEI